MTNSMIMNMSSAPEERGIKTMDEYYGFVQGLLSEERAHAARARLARQAQRAGEADGARQPTGLLAALRERIGHTLILLGNAVEGRGASHPHVPAGRAR